MNYVEFLINFMTGTGNSYRVSTWMGEAAANHGSRVHLNPVPKNAGMPGKGGGAGRLAGFVLPTHGFTAPWVMLRYVMQLPRGNGTHAVVVATRGGIKFGFFSLPGLEGTAGYIIAFLLALKGYNVRGVLAVDMPSNWMGLHPGLHPDNAALFIARGKAKTFRFMARALLGERVFGGFITLLAGLLLLPVSIGYLLLGRFCLAKLFFSSDRCNGCGQCAQYCPQAAIKMWGTRNRRPYWTYTCESCMRCMGYCPAGAVEVSHPLGVLLYYLITLPAGYYLLNVLAVRLPPTVNLNSKWIALLIQYPYALLSVYCAYLLFISFNRIPAVNRCFSFATLTHYYRRYHEPGTKLQDLGREEDAI